MNRYHKALRIINPQKLSEDKSLVPVKMRNEDPLSYYRSVFKKKKDIGETVYKKYYESQ